MRGVSAIAALGPKLSARIAERATSPREVIFFDTNAISYLAGGSAPRISDVELSRARVKLRADVLARRRTLVLTQSLLRELSLMSSFPEYETRARLLFELG